MNILVVMNDEGLERTYHQALKVARGHDLNFYGTRANALASFRQHQQDAVIVHGDAKDASGPRVVAAFRVLPKEPNKLIGLAIGATIGQQRFWEAARPDTLLTEFDLQKLLKALGASAKQS